MTYRTCVGCIFEKGHCAERERMRRALAGLAVTSIKWRCRFRRPRWQSGDAVFVELPVGEGDWEDTIFVSFPGIIIDAERRPTKPTVFVAPSVESFDGSVSFVPRGNGRGFLRIARGRIHPRAAVREHICRRCGEPARLVGHRNDCVMAEARAML